MGRASTKENKTIYQIYREESGLTRDGASELMDGVSSARIEKIEYEQTEPTAYDIMQMAQCYKRPELKNYYCTHECHIGKDSVAKVEVKELSNIVLEMIASLNEINPLVSKLVQITRDGVISEDELHDFSLIRTKLRDISVAVNELNLWVEKTAMEK